MITYDEKGRILHEKADPDDLFNYDDNETFYTYDDVNNGIYKKVVSDDGSLVEETTTFFDGEGREMFERFSTVAGGGVEHHYMYLPGDIKIVVVKSEGYEEVNVYENDLHIRTMRVSENESYMNRLIEMANK